MDEGDGHGFLASSEFLKLSVPLRRESMDYMDGAMLKVSGQTDGCRFHLPSISG
jgi:hypothetical protein